MKHTAIAAPVMLLAACGVAKEQPAQAPATSAPALQPGVAAMPNGTAPAASPARAAQAGPVSRYTSFKDCKLIEESEGEDWSVSQCPGLGGITLQINYGDAREDLALLRPGKQAAELGLIGLGLHGFNTLAEKVEWRGHDAKSGFVPTRLIVRNLLSERGDDAARQTSLLVVIDLARACVIAVVRPRPGQNEAARAVADGPPRSCVS